MRFLQPLKNTSRLLGQLREEVVRISQAGKKQIDRAFLKQEQAKIFIKLGKISFHWFQKHPTKDAEIKRLSTQIERLSAKIEELEKK